MPYYFAEAVLLLVGVVCYAVRLLTLLELKQKLTCGTETMA
jgi:hypothetical protein